MEVEEVTAKARELAAAFIADARNTDGPIVWVTGNQYQPALRSFTVAEEIWNLNTPDLWELFCEIGEMELTDANVFMGSHENSLYVVDLNRWAYTETPNPEFDVDSINSEWIRIA